MGIWLCVTRAYIWVQRFLDAREQGMELHEDGGIIKYETEYHLLDGTF